MHESLKAFKNLDSSALILKEIEKNEREKNICRLYDEEEFICSNRWKSGCQN